MATGFVVSGRGDLDALFLARVGAAAADTGFRYAGNDISQRYEQRAGTTAIANTNYRNSSGTDFAQIFKDINLSFTPITRTYSGVATGATETVPAGATTCVIKVWGGGGGGARTLAATGYGGGGGGYSERTVSVTGGQTFTYSVPIGGNGRVSTNGSGSPGNTGSVTSAAPSVSMSAPGGQPGTSAGGGAGGIPTGGTVNTNGGAGGSYLGGSSPNGGAASGATGNAPGGGGAGNDGANAFNGAIGRVQFAYT